MQTIKTLGLAPLPPHWELGALLGLHGYLCPAGDSLPALRLTFFSKSLEGG